MAITFNLSARYAETAQFFSRLPLNVSQGIESARIVFHIDIASTRTFGGWVQGNVTAFAAQTRAFTQRSRVEISACYRQVSTTVVEFPLIVATRFRHFSAQTRQRVNDTVERIREKINQTIDRVQNFVCTYKAELFLGLCSLITAALSPGLFISTMTISAIFTVVGHNFMKAKFAEYIKDEKNPYLSTPTYGPHYASPVQLTLGIIGTLSALTLTCCDEDVSLSLALLPVLGGIATGTMCGEIGLDIAHSINARFSPTAREID